MSGKLEAKNKGSKNKMPGPGEYKTRSEPGGKYHFSKYKNITNIIWGMDKSPRFNYIGKYLFLYR